MSKSSIPEAITIVKKSLSNQIEDIKKTSTMSSLILSVCLVDTLSGFYCGYEGKGKGHEKRFNKFTKEFLPEYSNFLHDLRNNLVHSFSNRDLNFMFILNQDFFDAFPNIERILSMKVFNVHKFKEAIYSCFEKYFGLLEESENLDLRANFMKRYTALGIIKDRILPVMRNMEGNIVSNINNADKMPTTNIPFGTIEALKTKN